VISIYCDGSSSGRSDEPGGWCFIIVINDKTWKMNCGGNPSTTNNRMEFTAAIEGLRYLKEHGGDIDDVVELVSDSQLTLGIANGKMTPSKNIDLAEPLHALAQELKARVRWVKGHNGNEYNERCDRFAKREKQRIIDRSKQ
jgi:ribonuclease HI